MKLDEERLSAYVDGELAPDERADVERELAADADAAAWVAEQRALRATLAATFDAALREPVPERLLAATREPGGAAAANDGASVARAGVSDLEAARARRSAVVERRRRWALPEWSAVAASFVLGAIAVLAFRGGSSDAPVAMRDGRLVAGSALAAALTAQPAGTPGEVTVAFSFRDRDGALCRAFTVDSTESALAGYACRNGADWRVDVLAPAARRAGGDYAQAGSVLPQVVLDSIDAQIAGEPLDATAEAAARREDWRAD